MTVAAPPTTAPLHVFQRLLLQWDDLHPYNAGQVLKIAGPADTARLTDAWEHTLANLGLGRVRRNGRHFHHQTLNGEMQQYGVRALPAGTNLCDFISAEL